MRIKILITVLGLVIGLPTIALGSSFTVSLIQGKTPSEAVQVLAEQMDSLFGRVENLESQQVKTGEDVTAAQLEIERLRLENDNLRLKTDAVISSTADIRAKNDRQNRCAELGTQINPKIKAAKEPYLQMMAPILEELRKLQGEKNQITKGPSKYTNVTAENISAVEEEMARQKQLFKEIEDKIQVKYEEMNKINLEMERAIQNLQNTPEMKALIDEAYRLSCA